ncbi:hypothetical protein [uncultured Deinococcus sp.]|uniref:hypothetical protein n=1 Tax=uncultured Deinococcus sp. TaxID=158789 RepID=UPI0025D7954E|nr:hypothetical protein [uncultured Deinococcus sp.]
MKLLTLGGLSIEGAPYRREKPLLLLAYLCLEGTQPRKHLAELFWPDAANPMNSLAQNLIRLRPLGDVVRENDRWVEPLICCDAADFRTHHRAGRIQDAVGAYRGAFLHGVVGGLNPDLEEWLLDTRTALGAEARAAWLTVAEHHHASGDPAGAAHHAELAYAAPGADPIDPEDIPRVWRLLGRTDHPLAVTLRREAAEFGVTLPTAPEPTPVPVSIVGRTAELAQLRALPPGQVAWISGPPGIGKSALLRALAAGGGWRILPGVDGLPLGTLEPLSTHPLSSTADAISTLRDTRLHIAIDGWEDCDDTTRTTLTLAARQHPGATIVITARQPPALPVTQHLPLHPLSEQELEVHPGAHAATGGHPTLLSAFLSGTPADRTLDAHLTLLGDTSRRVFLALAAQDTPHLNATRAALGIGAADLAHALDRLTREGLTTPEGHIRATTPARDLLDVHPLDTSLVHLHLARAHPKESAWPHWLKAKDLWEGQDEAKCAVDAHWYADQEMKRGYPAKAARTLEVAPQTDEVKLLRGWALLHSGMFHAALTCVDGVPSSQKSDALRATVLYRLGRNSEAEAVARSIPTGTSQACAHATCVLGLIARHHEDFSLARRLFRRSALLWQLFDNTLEHAQASALAASMECRLSVHPQPEREFKDCLHAATTPAARGIALVNYGVELELVGQAETAETTFLEAIGAFRESENIAGLAGTLNNLGLRRHLSGQLNEATLYYREAAVLTTRSGDIRLLGMALSNLSEIQADFTGFEDALELLIQSGQAATGELIQRNARAFVASGQSRSGHAI